MGTSGHPASSKGRESPGLGPVGTSVRSSLQEVGLSLGSVWCREGRGQVKRTRTEEMGLGTGPGERHRGKFGASQPEPQFNQSRGRE